MNKTVLVVLCGLFFGCVYYFLPDRNDVLRAVEAKPATNSVSSTNFGGRVDLPAGGISALPDPLASIRPRTSFDQARIDLQLRGLNISASRSLRQLTDDAELLGDARVAGKLMLWSMYCSSMVLYRETEKIPSVFPLPLRVSDKVANAQLRMLNDEDVKKRFGSDYQAATDYWERTLAPDEKFRAATLDAENKTYRQDMLSNAEKDCDGHRDKTRQENQQNRLRLLRESNTEFGELLRSRQLPEELRQNGREKAIQAILTSRDLSALEFVALTEGHSRHMERFPLANETDFFQPINMVVGRETLVLALCDLGIDCGPDSYWSRTACLDYGACAGETLAERWRNALRRDGLAEDLLDKEADATRDAIVRGDYDALGFRRRKTAP
jgi:hypothetical protein